MIIKCDKHSALHTDTEKCPLCLNETLTARIEELERENGELRDGKTPSWILEHDKQMRQLLVDQEKELEQHKDLVARLRNQADNVAADFEQVKRERDFLDEGKRKLTHSYDLLDEKLSIERKAWDIYDAMYPGVYHNADFFRKKAQEITMTKLISYKGRKFVALCNCNSDWRTNIVEKFPNQIMLLDPLLTDFVDTDNSCSECELHYWIILPKREKV